MPQDTTGQEPTTITVNNQATTGQEPTTNDKQPTGQEQQQKGGAQNVQELPEWARGLISELRNENARHRTAKTEAEKAAQEAEDQRMAKQQEWQQLADKRQARIAELEPLEAESAAITERIADMMNAEIKDWPEEVKALAPAEATSPAAMLDWLEKHRPLAARLTEKEAAPKPRGNGPAPRGATVQSNGAQRDIEVRRERIHRTF